MRDTTLGPRGQSEETVIDARRPIQMLTLALAVAGCGGDHPRVTGPRDVVEPPPGPTWDVTIEVRPGPGGTAAGADVQVASTVPVAGLLELHIGSADESGRLTFTGLAPNTYIVGGQGRRQRRCRHAPGDRRRGAGGASPPAGPARGLSRQGHAPGKVPSR